MSVPRVLGAAGLVLLIGGLGAALAAPAVGWFAYAPASGAPAAVTSAATLVFTAWRNVVVLGGVQVAGYVAALLGLVLLAVAGGYALGRRERR